MRTVFAMTVCLIVCSASSVLAASDATKASTKPVIPVPEMKWTEENRMRAGNFFVGPEYAEAPELKEKRGVPKGKVKTFTMQSKDSDRYPGISMKAPGVVPY